MLYRRDYAVAEEGWRMVQQDLPSGAYHLDQAGGTQKPDHRQVPARKYAS